MGQSDAAVVAIPTVYKGIQLKSRLEAQAAYLFDRLGWKWLYEPQSYMLSNGISYMPDFLLPDLNTIVECRGYQSEKGLKQIRGFWRLLCEGIEFAPDAEQPQYTEQIDRYVVLWGNEAPAVCDRHNRLTRLLQVIHCEHCGWQIPCLSTETCRDVSFFEAFCPSCIYPMEAVWSSKWDGRSRIDRAAIVTCVEGKIFVNSRGVDEFDA